MADHPGGRLTIITGGTRGIGAATALRLAADGHRLVLAYAADDESAEATATAVRETGAACHPVRCDLTTDEGLDALFAVAGEHGPLTGLVNNAGATFHIGPLADTEPDVVRRTIDLNLTAALLCARRAVLAMSTDRGGTGGVIVNVSSGAATLGSPGEYVQYAAAKAGIDAMTLGLGTEVAGQGIRVVGVAPGHIRTRMHADAGEPGRLDRVAPSIPLRRPGEPEEIAEAIAWLMSEAAGYVTGTTLRVAGGR
ncbi:SDR family oxidoreductase [Nocardioides sp.]|uniref:SDR family oxidoreductase n=1 Tax=Nocardioides sp. TaxID=35761 RepID=UPI003529199B